MTENDIESAFEAAALDFNTSLATMRPLRGEAEGYCEANGGMVNYFAFRFAQLWFSSFLAAKGHSNSNGTH